MYQLEYRLDTDAAGQRNWESRDTYLGVANKQYGTLVAGRLTAIDGYIDYANVTDGGVIGGDNVLASVDAPRANNAFAYFSPERQGLQFMGMYALDENNGSDTLNGDAFGVGVKYEPSGAPYRAGVTYIKASNAAKDRLGNDAKLQAIRVSGAYDLSPAVTVGGLYQNTNYNVGKENAYTVSGQYKVANTPWTAYGQLDLVDEVEGALDATRQRVAIGGKYAFSKAATGHLYGAYMRSQNINLSPAGQAQVAPNANAKANAYGVGVGLEYKF